jgi:hypothetical protein
MNLEQVTKEDLQAFRKQLMNDIKILLQSQNGQSINGGIEGCKTKDVRRILGCSVNKLVSLRVTRKIRWKKIGGTVYYNREDIIRLLEDGY